MATPTLDYDAEDPPEDHSLLLGPTTAGADRAKIRSSLVCDFEFWVSYDPDFTIYPGHYMYLLRMQTPNDSKKTDKKHNKDNTFNSTSTNAYDHADSGGGGGGGAYTGTWDGYTDLVKSSERTDSDSDTTHLEGPNGTSRTRLSEIDMTQHAKHDISGKILWYLSNQDNPNAKHLNFRKLAESDRFWTLLSLFFLCVLVIVILIFFSLDQYWWIMLIGGLVWILVLILLNRRYKSGYVEYHNNRMFELMRLCNKLNSHQTGFYKECFFELFQKETMSIIAWCNSRQYQRKAMIRVTPAMYTNIKHSKK